MAATHLDRTVAALDDDELSQFCALARDISLDALVEVHDTAELERALGAGGPRRCRHKLSHDQAAAVPEPLASQACS